MGMGMRMTGNTWAAPSGAATWQQRQQNVQALAKALQSDDLDAAKTAFTKVSANAPPRASADATSPLAQIGKALQSGDLTAAQQAFSALRQHHGPSRDNNPDAGAGAWGAAPPLPTATSGNFVNVMA